MHGLEKKTLTDDRFLNPSFSSTLLDKIYRSMDEGERKSSEMKFYRETTTTVKKQNRSNVKCNNRNMVELEEQGKGKDKKVGTEKQCFVPTTHHYGYHRDHDQDVLFFSSTSISSDSSSGGFSSSDTESMYGAMSRASCFAPVPKPKPVVKKNIDQTQAPTRMFDGFCHNSSKTEGIEIHDEKALYLKSKLRALKIYNNLKKVKQPISPGGRLTSFLNSLFATGNNAKKTRSSRSSSSSCYYEDMNTERKVKAKSVQASSTCSSASSFSRSCLSKTSSEREKMCNGVKRTVRFVDEESGPCGHKCLYEGEGKSKVLNCDCDFVAFNAIADNCRKIQSMRSQLRYCQNHDVATKIVVGRSNTKKKEEEIKLPVLEKRRVVEEAAREFVEEYCHNQKKDLPLRTNIVNHNEEEEEEGDNDDDDAASYASSDLFELDHLNVLGNGRYCEELPVFETTHVSANRVIANGLIM